MDTKNAVLAQYRRKYVNCENEEEKKVYALEYFHQLENFLRKGWNKSIPEEDIKWCVNEVLAYRVEPCCDPSLLVDLSYYLLLRYSELECVRARYREFAFGCEAYLEKYSKDEFRRMYFAKNCWRIILGDREHMVHNINKIMQETLDQYKSAVLQEQKDYYAAEGSYTTAWVINTILERAVLSFDYLLELYEKTSLIFDELDNRYTLRNEVYQNFFDKIRVEIAHVDGYEKVKRVEQAIKAIRNSLDREKCTKEELPELLFVKELITLCPDSSEGFEDFIKSIHLFYSRGQRNLPTEITDAFHEVCQVRFSAGKPREEVCSLVRKNILEEYFDACDARDTKHEKWLLDWLKEEASADENVGNEKFNSNVWAPYFKALGTKLTRQTKSITDPDFEEYENLMERFFDYGSYVEDFAKKVSGLVNADSVEITKAASILEKLYAGKSDSVEVAEAFADVFYKAYLKTYEVKCESNFVTKYMDLFANMNKSFPNIKSVYRILATFLSYRSQMADSKEEIIEINDKIKTMKNASEEYYYEFLLVRNPHLPGYPIVKFGDLETLIEVGQKAKKTGKKVGTGAIILFLLPILAIGGLMLASKAKSKEDSNKKLVESSVKDEKDRENLQTDAGETEAETTENTSEETTSMTEENDAELPRMYTETREINYSGNGKSDILIDYVSETIYTQETVDPFTYGVFDRKMGFVYPTLIYSDYEKIDQSLADTNITYLFKGSDGISELSVNNSSSGLSGTELFDRAYDLVGFSADQIIEQGEDYCYAKYENDGATVYQLLDVDEHNYYTLTLKIPSPADEEDLKIKEYYAACIIRMCGFGTDEKHESMIYEP